MLFVTVLGAVGFAFHPRHLPLHKHRNSSLHCMHGCIALKLLSMCVNCEIINISDSDKLCLSFGVYPTVPYDIYV